MTMMDYRNPRGNTARMIGELLSNAGMGIMGLSMKRPDLAMQAFGRPLSDPRAAMMDAARLDLMTQEMALRQAQAAREAEAEANRQAYIASQPPALQGIVAMTGADKHAAMVAKRQMEGPDPLSQWEAYAYGTPEEKAAAVGFADLKRQPETQITIEPPVVQTEWDKAAGKGGYAQFEGIQKDAQSAQSVASQASQIEQLVGDLETGKFTGTGLEFKKAIKSAADVLGIETDFENLGELEAAQALSNQMALQLRSTGEGGGMPGSMSDSDREFLRSMTPGIEQTPEGRRIMVEAYKRLADRKREAARLAREYVKENGRWDYGFYDEMQRYADANPLFNDLQGNMPSAPSSATVTRPSVAPSPPSSSGGLGAMVPPWARIWE